MIWSHLLTSRVPLQLVGRAEYNAEVQSPGIQRAVAAFQSYFVALTLVMCPAYAGSHGPDPRVSPNEFVKDVVTNELRDRTEQGNWMYRVSKLVDQQMLGAIEVETKDGPVHRLLAINDVPLNSVQREQETVETGATHSRSQSATGGQETIRRGRASIGEPLRLLPGASYSATTVGMVLICGSLFSLIRHLSLLRWNPKPCKAWQAQFWSILSRKGWQG